MTHIVRSGKKAYTPAMVCKAAVTDAYLATTKMQSNYASMTKNVIEAHPMTVLMVQLGDYYVKSLLGAIPKSKEPK